MQHLLKIFLYSFNRNSFSKLKQTNKQQREPFPFQSKLHWQVLLHSFLQTSGERPEMPSTGLIRDPQTYYQVILLLSLDPTTVFLYSTAAQYTPL